MENREVETAQKTFVEFFAGIGLMRIGLEREGWRIVFANDIDPRKEEMYKANFPDAERHFVLSDVHTLSPSVIPTATLATASFPCNDLSVAGAREGLDGKNSSAFWGFMSILKRMKQRRPTLVLIENVTGFLTSHGGSDFEDAMLALNDLGYSVDPFIMDAAWFVPQSRQRLFVVAVTMEELECREATRRFYESRVRPASLADFIFKHPNIQWKIRDLPDPPHGLFQLKDILEDIPENSPDWWNSERARYLLSQMSSRHRLIADDMISSRTWSYGTVFRRIRNGKSMAELRTDGLAGCLRTPRGGSGRQILFKAGYGKYHVRLLSPRECARLLGADDFKVAVPLNQALFGFGDAVCVPVIGWIAQNYLNLVWKKLYAKKTSDEKSARLSTYPKAVNA